MGQAVLSVDVLKQFRIIFKSVKTHFSTVEDDCRISGSQLWALSIVVREPGILVTALAKSLAVHQSTASNLVEKLVIQGLLRRERAAYDQRRVHLYPTDVGISLLDKAPLPLEGLLPHALSQLAPETLAQLHASLAETIRHMEHVEKNAAHTPLADL